MSKCPQKTNTIIWLQQKKTRTQIATAATHARLLTVASERGGDCPTGRGVWGGGGGGEAGGGGGGGGPEPQAAIKKREMKPTGSRSQGPTHSTHWFDPLIIIGVCEVKQQRMGARNKKIRTDLKHCAFDALSGHKQTLKTLQIVLLAKI